jgi:hypothetical protein
MQAAIDRVMKIYGMMVKLNYGAGDGSARKSVQLRAGKPVADEMALVIEGLRYLRGERERASGMD